MGYIYAWVKNLVCFYILLTVVLHLLPKDNYQKYVRFFFWNAVDDSSNVSSAIADGK